MKAVVDIVMVTFNHEQYIAEAIDSVFNQVCDFPFRLIIADDCSTDGTTKICETYESKFTGKILRITQRINVGLVQNYDTAFKACNAEFIAILEGDDIWTDPSKLQKQVDILKASAVCGLVHTAFNVKEHTGKLRRANLNLLSQKAEGFLYEAVMRDQIAFCPLTVVFRRSLLAYVDYDFCIKNNVWTIDAFLWPEIARRAEVKYIPEVTGIYRRVHSAATSTRNPEKLVWYYKTGLAMKVYYLNKYPVAGLAPDSLEESFLKALVRKLIQTGATELAIKYARELKPKAKRTAIFKYAAMSPALHTIFHAYDNLFQFLSAVKQKAFYK